MAEIKVTPQHSASYIDSNPKKLKASLALPFVCVSYVGKSLTPAEHYEGTISGTVESLDDVTHLTPSSHVSFIGCDTKITESSVALPVVCVSYVPSSVINVDLDFDTARNISNVVTVNHDTCRNISKAQTLSADLMRDVTASAELNLDSVRIIASPATVDVDTERKINGAIPTTANFDLSRNVTATQNFSIDIKRDVIISLALTADTSREVLNANIPQTLNVDTCRNVCQSVTLLCDTARITQGGSVTLLCDTQRIITADGFWRYENFGTADLLSTSGTTVTNLTTNQAVYQTAFYQSNRAKCFDIPATKEIWIKCDINVVSNVSSSRIRIYNEDSNGIACGWSTDGNGITSNYLYWINSTNYDGGYRIARNDEGSGKQPFLLHMKSGVTDGFLEIYFWSKSNGSYRSFTGNVNNGNDFDNVYIQMDGSNIYVSDLIISNVAVDINEHTKYPLAFRVDLLRNVVETFAQQFYVDTLRNVVRSNLLNLDTLRELILSAGIDYDTFRNVISTVEQNLDAVRTLAHNLILSPVYNFGDLPDTSNDRRAGLQSFEIQIAEQQLTDSVNFVSVNPVDILEQVKGQYLDYKFNMRVEKITQRGILRTCNCCCDIDELLFKQLDYVIPEEKMSVEYARPPVGLIEPREEDKILRYAPASEHINAIAASIGKTPVLQFADFVSNVDIESGGTTYNDLIKAIFGWSARVPQMMINCYLRDDKLFVIQRGYESNIVDLTNYQSDVVSVSKDIVRTYWGSHLWSETEVTERPAGYDVDFITKAAPTEKVDDNGNKTTYTPSSSGKVLVTQTEETVNGQTIIKTFDYDDDDFLILSTEQGNNYKITTAYEYKTFGKNQKVLVRETTTVSEQNSSGVWEVTDQRTTSHDYLYEGGGQVYVSSNVTDLADVDHTGNVVGNKNGNDRISPYQIYIWEDGERKALEGIIKTPIYDKVHRTIYGVTLFDSSFPIHGDDKLIEITDAIKWLNRKTQEVINLNVYDFPHVIDFNDRIVFGGNTYFLKTNTALKNADIVNKQSISAVRWY